MTDASVASIARTLSEALRDAAYERSDAAKKRVAELHFALVEECRAETEGDKSR
jgi:hypothetical protein